MGNRIEKLRARFGGLGISGFIVMAEELWHPKEHLRYLVDFEGEGVLLIKADRACFITDDRYEEAAKKELKGIEVFVYNLEDVKAAPNAAIFAAMKRLILLEPGEKIGIEAERLATGAHQKLQKFFPQTSFLLVERLIDEISVVKTEDEVAQIQKAVAITEHIFSRHILPRVRPGLKEIDLAQEISIQGKKHGAESDGWPPVVASGPNSSSPHHLAGQRVLQKGDILQFDIGYFFNGYCSDFSRVVIVGQEPTEEQKEVYQIVLTAQLAALEAIRPGVTAKRIWEIAYELIKNSKYGQFCFGHSLGHGIGIKVHTEPRLNITDSHQELQPGYVVTVEPAIYIPGWGGMRIEDVVVMTEGGCKNLTTASKELKIAKEERRRVIMRNTNWTPMK